MSKLILTLNYIQLIWEIAGLAALSAFGFYAIRLVASFRNGILAKSWKQVTIGAIFLASAQFPLLASAISPSGAAFSLVEVGTLMRLIGVVFLTIGLRSQSRI